MNKTHLSDVFSADDTYCIRSYIAFAVLMMFAFLIPLLSIAEEGISPQDMSLKFEVAREKSLQGHPRIGYFLKKKISTIKEQLAKIPPAIARTPVDLSSHSTPLVKINADGHIQVYIHISKWGKAEQQELEKLGVRIEIANTALGIIQAWMPHQRIEQAADLEFVSRITVPSYGESRAGSVQTEGDAVLGGDDVRALGFDGSGVNVGVISTGVLGLSTAQSSGDLPSVTVLDAGFADAEGTAMLEIVHDIAPGATLGFCGMPSLSSLEFIQCVNLLDTSFNADIIVDDIGFFSEPYFEDGNVAQSVKAAVNAGIFYTSAAGNDAERHYEDDYLFNGFIFGFHDFGTRSGGAADTYANFLIHPGETLIVFLQWSEPFGGACSNYDLVLFGQLLNILHISNMPQDCDDDPLEIVFYTNTSPFTIPASIAIDKIWGNDVLLEMFYTLEPEEYNVEAGSVWGHAAVRGVMSVGAIDYSDPGNDDINTFSSRGPSIIFFPASDIREKPDITAIDGVSVTGAGGFPTNFTGTSAAAPHVAAIAALLMSANTSATATETSDAIKNSAVDLGSAGPDLTYGYGRIDALAALFLVADQDGDGILDNVDNCPAIPNAGQIDSDSDEVGDTCDNCILKINTEQQDTDGDGHGNACDADFDHSCFVNFNDLTIFKANFFTSSPDHDLDSSGFVNFNDLTIMKALFFQAPGPSAAGSLCNP